MLASALRGVQLVLLALCAFLVYATVAPHLSAAPAVRDVRLGAAAEPEPTRPLEDYALVWKQSPFGKPMAALLKQKPGALAKAAAASKLTWKLVTTAAATPRELSVAGLVSTKDGSRKIVRVGDEISGRTVVDIERKRVIFSFRGKLEQLAINETSARRATASQRPKSRRAAASRAPRTRPARARLGTRMPAPKESEAEPPAGPSASEIAEVFSSQIELAPGESIASVNGLPLDDPSLGALANAGGNVVVQIRGEDGSEREVVLGEDE
jgi:hypothetical protein